MEVSLKKTAEGVILTVVGEGTLPYADQLKQEIVAAFAQPGSLTLDLEGLEGLDLAGMQVLGAAHRWAVVNQRDFHVVGCQQNLFKQTVIDSGFARQHSCNRMGLDHNCLWVINH